jgi:hypothetical protein
MALYGDGCERYCQSRRSDRAGEFVERIISAGPINSSRPRDCSPWMQPGSWRANPDEETTDWRAVCGRTARTVRRAGTARAVSDPYPVCSNLFPRASYFLLEDPDMVACFRADPQGFLDAVKTPAILDEVQNVPEIFSFVRSRIDRQPRRTGQWLLTGSQEAPADARSL